MDIMERAKEMEASGKDIIHLEVGEPDFDTPLCVQKAAAKAMHEGHTHYTHSMGLPALREAISRHYKKTYGANVSPEQIIITSGSSPGLLMAFACLMDAGDEIIMTDPYYACYRNFARFLDVTPKFIPLYADEGFQLDPVRVKNAINRKTRAILINSPANPTGVCLDETHMKEIAGLGVPVISDEIYHGLVYNRGQHTILEYTDNAIVVNGFSKAYAMTGWRLGWTVLPQDLVRIAQKMHQNLMICAPSTAQWGGIAAIDHASQDAAKMKETFERRRKVMLETMGQYNIKVAIEPTGAFYVLTDMRGVDMDSMKLAIEILENTGVGLTPGIDFGQQAQGHLRFSYANSEENIIKGIQRVGEYLDKRR